MNRCRGGTATTATNTVASGSGNSNSSGVGFRGAGHSAFHHHHHHHHQQQQQQQEQHFQYYHHCQGHAPYSTTPLLQPHTPHTTSSNDHHYHHHHRRQQQQSSNHSDASPHLWVDSLGSARVGHSLTYQQQGQHSHNHCNPGYSVPLTSSSSLDYGWKPAMTFPCDPGLRKSSPQQQVASGGDSPSRAWTRFHQQNHSAPRVVVPSYPLHTFRFGNDFCASSDDRGGGTRSSRHFPEQYGGIGHTSRQSAGFMDMRNDSRQEIATRISHIPDSSGDCMTTSLSRNVVTQGMQQVQEPFADSVAVSSTNVSSCLPPRALFYGSNEGPSLPPLYRVSPPLVNAEAMAPENSDCFCELHNNIISNDTAGRASWEVAPDAVRPVTALTMTTTSMPQTGDVAPGKVNHNDTIFSGSKVAEAVGTADWVLQQQREQTEDVIARKSSPAEESNTTQSGDMGLLTPTPPPALSSKQSHRSLQQMMRSGSKSASFLLPPQIPAHIGRATCCLDLDDTLVHTFELRPPWWDPQRNSRHFEIEVDIPLFNDDEIETLFSNNNGVDDNCISSNNDGSDGVLVTPPSTSSSQWCCPDSGVRVMMPPPRGEVRSQTRERLYVCIRPYASEFLQTCLDNFEVVFFTTGTEEYARTILDHLDPGRCAYRLYRQHCTRVGDKNYKKDLSLLGRPLDRVILVDDRGPEVSFQGRNVLFCDPFILEDIDDPLERATNDCDLCGYARLLETLARLPNDKMLEAMQDYQTVMNAQMNNEITHLMGVQFGEAGIQPPK